MKTKKQGIIKLMICTILAVYATIVYIINIRYPSYSEKDYFLEDTLILNSIRYSVEQYHTLSYSEFKETYPSIAVDNLNQSYIIVDLSVENTTSQDLYVPIDQFILELTGWASNVSVHPLFYLNDNLDGYRFKLGANESTKLYLPYAFYEDNPKQNIFQTIIRSDISLNLYMEYPQKISVLLNRSK